jgi:hypothetical protein
MKYRTYRKIVEFESQLTQLRDPELLLKFNKIRTELGVKTSLGTSGCVVYEPNLKVRLLNWFYRGGDKYENRCNPLNNRHPGCIGKSARTGPASATTAML